MSVPRPAAQRRRRGMINMLALLIGGVAFVLLGLTGIWWFIALGLALGVFAVAGLLKLRAGWGVQIG